MTNFIYKILTWLFLLFFLLSACLCFHLTIQTIKMGAERDITRAENLVNASDNKINTALIDDLYKHDTTFGNLYLAEARVSEIDASNDVTILMLTTGEMYKVIGNKGLESNDPVIALLGDCGTPYDVTDDRIVRLWVDVGA